MFEDREAVSTESTHLQPFTMRDFVTNLPLLRAPLLAAYRLKIMCGYIYPLCSRGLRWVFVSRETTNFTYDLVPTNKAYLCDTLALITGLPREDFHRYIKEIEDDKNLIAHVVKTTEESALAFKADRAIRLHKRVGWYALVRAIKPKVVIETGVDKGLGSVVLCSALLRNLEEGHAGRYYGTDLNPKAGYLLKDKYAEVGKILYGDSITSLEGLNEPIDLFINDSDHSADYELREYQTVVGKMAPEGIILGDNSHVTDKLMTFSHLTGRKFLFWKEEPLDHWYPGGGIGFSWK